MRFVIATGDAFNGITLYGVYECYIDALDAAEDSDLDNLEIVPLHTVDCLNNGKD